MDCCEPKGKPEKAHSVVGLEATTIAVFAPARMLAMISMAKDQPDTHVESLVSFRHLRNAGFFRSIIYESKLWGNKIEDLG